MLVLVTKVCFSFLVIEAIDHGELPVFSFEQFRPIRCHRVWSTSDDKVAVGRIPTHEIRKRLDLEIHPLAVDEFRTCLIQSINEKYNLAITNKSSEMIMHGGWSGVAIWRKSLDEQFDEATWLFDVRKVVSNRIEIEYLLAERRQVSKVDIEIEPTVMPRLAMGVGLGPEQRRRLADSTVDRHAQSFGSMSDKKFGARNGTPCAEPILVTHGPF